MRNLREARPRVEVASGITAQSLLTVKLSLFTPETTITRQIIEAGKELKLIARAGVGVDKVDVMAAPGHSVLVMNAHQGNTARACGFPCAHILSISGDVHQATKSLKVGL